VLRGAPFSLINRIYLSFPFRLIPKIAAVVPEPERKPSMAKKVEKPKFTQQLKASVSEESKRVKADARTFFLYFLSFTMTLLVDCRSWRFCHVRIKIRIVGENDNYVVQRQESNQRE